MRKTLAFVLCLVVATSIAQEKSHPNGTISGVATTPDNRPAQRIRLTAVPLGVALATALPTTTTNDSGEYRFEKLPWWGRYTVYADDERAGYSSYATGNSGQTQPSEVELSPDRPEGRLAVHLPPKAAGLRVNLTNSKTGAPIEAMRIAVLQASTPEVLLFTMSCNSNKVVLLPPEKDLLLHISSFGFAEWNESVGRGKALRLASGMTQELNVELEPSK